MCSWSCVHDSMVKRNRNYSICHGVQLWTQCWLCHDSHSRTKHLQCNMCALVQGRDVLFLILVKDDKSWGTDLSARNMSHEHGPLTCRQTFSAMLDQLHSEVCWFVCKGAHSIQWRVLHHLSSPQRLECHSCGTQIYRADTIFKQDWAVRRVS